uniref:Tripartite motif containing 61 n=1 Tax=Rhinolophus ferrumequinum TaxID=59479 RepID=A0A671F8W4_RHIFE
MAFAVCLAKLQAEARCSICLDYLRDPMTIECGHNFCHSCIHQRWEDLQDIFPCPICLHHCSDRNFKRNIQLCHMTDIIKQLPTPRSKRKRQEEKPLCKKHNEVLALFCEKDLELLCPQCGVSSDHEAHHLIPIEEAAASQRSKLKSFIEPLREQAEDAEMGYEKEKPSHTLLVCGVASPALTFETNFEWVPLWLCNLVPTIGTVNRITQGEVPPWVPLTMAGNWLWGPRQGCTFQVCCLMLHLLSSTKNVTLISPTSQKFQ